jgi:hypothetical protein
MTYKAVNPTAGAMQLNRTAGAYSNAIVLVATYMCCKVNARYKVWENQLSQRLWMHCKKRIRAGGEYTQCLRVSTKWKAYR